LGNQAFQIINFAKDKEKTWKWHEDSEQKNTEASKVIWS
jgi:hypothetical protein